MLKKISNKQKSHLHLISLKKKKRAEKRLAENSFPTLPMVRKRRMGVVEADQWHSPTDGSVREPIIQMDVFINNYQITNLNSVSFQV